MSKKVTIIGAGPAGNFTAYLLAKAGMQVEIYENHNEVGKPVQCSGLVTKTIKNIDPIFSSLEGITDNKIKKVRLYSKNEEVDLELENPDTVLNRAKFDKFLALKATAQGAEVNLNSKFIFFRRTDGKIISRIQEGNRLKDAKSDILIGADGYFSKVSKLIGNKQECIPCIQVIISGTYARDTMDIYFSEQYRELFAWVVPTNDTFSEIGLGCKDNLEKKYTDFKLGYKSRYSFDDIVGYTGGPIPLYNSKAVIEDKNVFLVGDAASQVKATTLGGIIPSLRAAKVLAESIIEGSSYEQKLKEIRKELALHSKLREILNKFRDSDYDALFRLLKNEKVKKIFSEYSRDELADSKILRRLVFAEPRFLKFARFF
ncbi:MAG: NAD(P)/FAD-dependent oxidoreductase [Nanoarchaeota archaeon]